MSTKYHLKRGDYASWFRDSIQDADLAGVAKQVQHADAVSAQDRRNQIIEMIRKLDVREI